MKLGFNVSADGRSEQRQGIASAWLALIGGAGTLLCCALPALLVTLGAGAVLSSLISAVPQIVWLSEHKAEIFGLAVVLMAVGAVVQWRNRNAPCPIDPALRAACLRTRRWSLAIYVVALVLLVVGAWFAFFAIA